MVVLLLNTAAEKSGTVAWACANSAAHAISMAPIPTDCLEMLIVLLQRLKVILTTKFVDLIPFQ